jgi:hypothetical protein
MMESIILFERKMSQFKDLSIVAFKSKDNEMLLVRNKPGIRNFSSLDWTILTEDEFKNINELPEGTKNLYVVLRDAS